MLMEEQRKGIMNGGLLMIFAQCLPSPLALLWRRWRGDRESQEPPLEMSVGGWGNPISLPFGQVALSKLAPSSRGHRHGWQPIPIGSTTHRGSHAVCGAETLASRDTISKKQCPWHECVQPVEGSRADILGVTSGRGGMESQGVSQHQNTPEKARKGDGADSDASWH